MRYLACRHGAEYQPQWGISAFQDTSIVCLCSNTSFQKSWSQALGLCGYWIHSPPTASGKGPHSPTHRAMGIPGVSSHIIPEQDQNVTFWWLQSTYLWGHHGWHVSHGLHVPGR